MENKKDGFRVGNYFCVLPEGNFIEETKDDGVYITLEIYRVEKDNSMVSISADEITPDIEEQINIEINKMMLAAIEQAEKDDKNV
jgi:hypothetical protein